MGKTDLEKSHSKVSNFKLTLICLLLSIFICVIWVGLGLLGASYNDVIAYAAIGVGAVGSILSFMMVSKFTR